MKKLLAVILILSILIMVFPVMVNANPSYEDFTTYIEVEPDNRIQVTTNHIDFTSYRNEEAYLYKNKGVDYFEDFDHKVDSRCGGGGVWSAYVWGLSNEVNGLYDCQYSLGLIMHDNDNKFYLRENYDGTKYSTSSSDIWEDNKLYYLRIKKTDTSFTCDVYSTASNRDSETNKLTNLCTSLTLQSDESYRYVYGCSGTYWDTQTSYTTVDVEYLDLGLIDNPPYYSDIGDNDVTQVGEYVTCSSYWQDDFELDTCYVQHNSTGTSTNYSISVSGTASWANKTFQLNFTANIKVQYKFWCSDNASQWNSTGYYYITTTSLYVIFNHNNSTYGRFYVDYVNTANQTQNSYNFNQTIFLLGATYNASYVWCNFTYGITIITGNFYEYKTDGNKTLWCNFDIVTGNGNSEYTESDLEEHFIVGAIVAVIIIVTFGFIVINKKDVIRR